MQGIPGAGAVPSDVTDLLPNLPDLRAALPSSAVGRDAAELAEAASEATTADGVDAAPPRDQAVGGGVTATAGGGLPVLVWLEVRGFRAFGTEPRRLDLDAPLPVVHGRNSQGKSSLAEALEFLLTGRSSSRDLLGGAKATYHESLRDVHLPAGDQAVWVAADLRGGDGQVHEVRRELVCDFAQGTECESQLLVDGAGSATSRTSAWLPRRALPLALLCSCNTRCATPCRPCPRTASPTSSPCLLTAGAQELGERPDDLEALTAGVQAAVQRHREAPCRIHRRPAAAPARSGRPDRLRGCPGRGRSRGRGAGTDLLSRPRRSGPQPGRGAGGLPRRARAA